MTTRAVMVQYFQHLRRDHTGLLFLVVFPALIMALLGNIYTADSGSQKIAVSMPVPSAQNTLFIDRLEQPGRLQVVRVATRAEIDDLVRRGRVAAGLVLPSYGRFDGGKIELVGAPDVEAPVGVRQSVESAIAETVVITKVQGATSASKSEVEKALGLGQRDGPIDFQIRSRRQAAIATLVLVTFTNLIAIGSLIPAHRTLGVMPRLRAAGMSEFTMVRAYLATFVAAGGLQVAVGLTVGSVLLGVSWGPLALVALATAALALVAGAAGVLAGTLLPTSESGASTGGTIGFILGMLGGCLWPLSIVSRRLQLIGHLTPQAWFVDAFDRLADRTVPLSALVTPALAISVFATALLALGTARLARSWR